MRKLVYISYSHRDKRFHRELRKVLDVDVRLKDIVWDDTKIPKGANVWTEIHTHVAVAKIMVMLVSPNYLADDALKCEIMAALEAVKGGNLTVLWIPVGKVRVEDTPFPYIMAASDVSCPLSDLRAAERTRHFELVRDEIAKLLNTNTTGQYDVFLSYNSNDKPDVQQVAQELKKRGLKVWLDEEQLLPGQLWQDEIEKVIETTKSATIFFGPNGVGPWEAPEMRGCLSQFVERRAPVIPALLPGANKPNVPLFLKQFTWLDMSDGITPSGIDRLVLGITCQRPAASATTPTSESSATLTKTPLPKLKENRGSGPIVHLSASQMILVFISLALLSTITFFVNARLSYVFIALTAAIVLFGFLSAVAEVKNRFGRFGGSAATFVATLSILLFAESDSTPTIPSTTSPSTANSTGAPKPNETDREKQIRSLITFADEKGFESMRATALDDKIKCIEDAIAKLRSNAELSTEFEVLYREAILYNSLMQLHLMGHNFEHATEAGKNEFTAILPIYQVNPSWKSQFPLAEMIPLGSPPERAQKSQPIAVAVFMNRTQWPFLVSGKLKCRVDANTQKVLQDAIAFGCGALQHAEATNDVVSGFWLTACLANYVNGSVDSAIATLQEAKKPFGDPGPVNKETELRCKFFGDYFFFLGLMQAEQRKCPDAIESIKKAKEYYQDIPYVHEYAQAYLLIAHASQSDSEIQHALKFAEDELSRGDDCFICRYKRASILAKKSELDPGQQDKLTKEAADHLVYVLRKLEDYPVEPDLEELRKDPFLKPILSRSEVDAAIKAYRWKPLKSEFPPPIMILWADGIPLSRVRFTRLFGSAVGS